MGYTHYWLDESEGDELPADAVRLIRKVTDEAHCQELIQREHGDPRPPVVTNKEVRFNGVGEDGHETFHFVPGEQAYFSCNTARKPYNAIVMRVLLVLAYYRPGLALSSDDAFRDEWRPALDWFNDQGIGGVCIEECLRFYRLAKNGRFIFDHDA